MYSQMIYHMRIALERLVAYWALFAVVWNITATDLPPLWGIWGFKPRSTLIKPNKVMLSTVS